MADDARWESPLKRRLAAGESIFGVTITTPSVDIAARAAALGFDFLWLELEHSPITLESARHIVLATRGSGAVPLARVPVNELWTARRALDAGVHGVIFPFTSTVALAQQAVAACRYPPNGRRGSGAGLATASWPDPDRYYDSADANILTIAIIEEARALDEVEAIAATRGSTRSSSARAICRSRWGFAADTTSLRSTPRSRGSATRRSATASRSAARRRTWTRSAASRPTAFASSRPRPTSATSSAAPARSWIRWDVWPARAARRCT